MLFFLAPVISGLLTSWALPEFSVLPLVTAILGLILVSGCFWLVMRFSGNGIAWRDIHKLALISGPLMIFIIMTPLQEFNVNRTNDTTGMTIVGVVAMVFLVLLFWKTIRITREVLDE